MTIDWCVHVTWIQVSKQYFTKQSAEGWVNVLFFPDVAVNLGATCVQQKDTIIFFPPRLLCRVWRRAMLQGDRLSFFAVLFPNFENLSSEAHRRGFHKVTPLKNTKALTGFPHYLMYRGCDTWEQVLEMNASFLIYSCAGLGAVPTPQQTECLVPFISSFWCEIQQMLHPSCNAVFL